MRLELSGDIKGLEIGIQILSCEMGFDVGTGADTFRVCVANKNANKLKVWKRNREIGIEYSGKIHFFRALGLMVEALENQEDEFDITEQIHFDMNGIMVDVSQSNAVPRVTTVKKLLNKMAVMGLNMFMIYMEDSYTIEDEPYFGYMRGRYSFEELKELDDYADALGIEIIPGIQTLAHLKDVLKWECYQGIIEDEDTLLVGEPGAYTFIEKMISAASAPFRTNRIHIGMDEAWRLGLGEYLKRNGLKSKHDIMTEHLGKIVQITDKLGLKPMIWSDMFFRTDRLTGYGNNYDPDIHISREVKDNVPKALDMVFWDYNQDNEEFYRRVVRKHEEFGRKPVFAGGIWNWMGFGVNYGITFRTSNAALKACKEENVREVFATLWGDCTTENNIFSNLLGMQLFAEHGYERELNIDKLKRRFEFCTRCSYDHFINIKYLDETPGVKDDNMAMCNPSRYLLWQNILMGLYDKDVEGIGLAGHYERLSMEMKNAVEHNGEYGFIFELLEKLCSVLSIKSELGIEIKDAYDNKKTSVLKDISERKLVELSKRVADLRWFHRGLWYKTNKAFGWEVLDLRYGALLMNIDSTKKRIYDYLAGEFTKIDELEEKRLYFNSPGIKPVYDYSKMLTASRISH